LLQAKKIEFWQSSVGIPPAGQNLLYSNPPSWILANEAKTRNCRFQIRRLIVDQSPDF